MAQSVVNNLAVLLSPLFVRVIVGEPGDSGGETLAIRLVAGAHMQERYWCARAIEEGTNLEEGGIVLYDLGREDLGLRLARER
jgi:hypothetical protein